MIPCANAAVPWENPKLVSLLHELRQFPDIQPCWMRGGHPAVEQPWVMPKYGQSAELEVCDLLYSLVRYLRPSMVVELGCHIGIGTYSLARACQDNNHGKVFTCDIEPEYIHTTVERLGALWMDWAEVHSVESARMMHMVGQSDFLWLDCDYEGRMEALKHLKPGAVAVVHDTRQEPMLADYIRSLDLEYVQFGQTHRGLSVVQRKLLT